MAKAPSEQWQLSGNSPESYEEYLVPLMFKPWAEKLIDSVSPKAGNKVLDVACGTGIVARTVAPLVGESGSVTGFDINQSMLETASKAAKQEGQNIRWQQGDARALPFKDKSYDVVFCQHALQFFPDPGLVLTEMNRCLRPGGKLALSVWRSIEHNPVYISMADALEQHAGKEAGAMMRSPFSRWNIETLRDLVGEAGFTDVVIRIEIGSMRYPSAEEFLRREAASSPLAGPIEALDTDVRRALVSDIGKAISSHIDDEGVVFPMESYFITARA